jgi:hypothetical protein
MHIAVFACGLKPAERQTPTPLPEEQRTDVPGLFAPAARIEHGCRTMLPALTRRDHHTQYIDSPVHVLHAASWAASQRASAVGCAQEER